MTIDTNPFWSLITSSRLIPPDKLPTLFAEFRATAAGPKSDGSDGSDGPHAAAWLIKQKALTDYQAEILLAGHSGPFHYGNYVVTGPFSSVSQSETPPASATNLQPKVPPNGESAPPSQFPTRRHFKAIHPSTQHRVLLEFFAGNEHQDLQRWQETESFVAQVADLTSPHLISVFESVVVPEYRFVVSARPNGVLLSDRLPARARMPWKDGCLIVAQVAAGLRQLHQHGLAHGAMSPQSIWIAKNGTAQIQLFLPPNSRSTSPASETQAAPVPTPASDALDLGSLLAKTITGRSPVTEKEIVNLERFELPSELESLIHQLLAENPQQRLLALDSASQTLETLSGESMAKRVPANARSLQPYRHSIGRFQPGQTTPIVVAPNIKTDSTTLSPGTNRTPQSQLPSPHPSLRARQTTRWTIPAAIVAGVGIFLLLLGLFAWQASRKILPNSSAVATAPTAQPNTVGNSSDAKGNNASNSAAPSSATKHESLTNYEQQRSNLAAMDAADRPIVIQRLVDDDRETLWETPTLGAPIDLSGIPAAPKMLLIFRPAELTATPEGERLLNSMGPNFRSRIDRWLQKCGLDASEIRQVIVSLHTTRDFEYEPFFRVTTTEPLDKDRAFQIWNHPRPAETESGERYFVSQDSEQAFYFLPNGEPTRDGTADAQDPQNANDSNNADDPHNGPPDLASDSVRTFAFGSPALTSEVAQRSGAAIVGGSLASLASWTDRNRHFNFLFLRTALFNDEGQKLMGDRLQNFNRELATLIPDSVRGGALSLHLDRGTYLELRMNRHLDIKATALKEQFPIQLRKQRDRLIQFVATVPPSPYWESVRQQYDNMLIDLFRNLRWGVEHQEVVANAWLPPMAAHNLLAASELTASFYSGTSDSPKKTATPSGPQTLEELLDLKRDLKIANPPDLNLLIAGLEEAVKEDHPQLPFKFQIRLLGGDLELEGITKNQRPSALNIEQTSLAQILTQIMTSANPAKDISGPADPECKLVWVIAESPDTPGVQAILITTREAARQKSYALPPVFQQP